MNRLIYPFIALFILILAYFMPKFYMEIFSKKTTFTQIKYSPIDEDFIKITVKRNTKDAIFSDLNETKFFDFETYVSKLPFIFYQDTIKLKKIPKRFLIHFQDINRLSKEVKTTRIKPKDINKKIVMLFPLFESKPKYSSLQMPDDLFGFSSNGLLFINANTNMIDDNKSKIYNQALKDKGFTTFFKKAFGNPTTRKPFDEGYFLLDDKNQIFHLKQINSKPFVKKLDLQNIAVKYILIQENPTKEYYGFLISQKSEIFLIMYDDYKLIKLPIDYNFNFDKFIFQTTPINRVVSLQSSDNKDKIYKTYLLDLDYNLLKQNIHKVPLTTGFLYEILQEWIFPVEIKISKDIKPYAIFQISNINYKAFMINLILAFMFFLIKRKHNLKLAIMLSIIIFIGGIYSVIALMLFKKQLKG